MKKTPEQKIAEHSRLLIKDASKALKALDAVITRAQEWNAGICKFEEKFPKEEWTHANVDKQELERIGEKLDAFIQKKRTRGVALDAGTSLATEENPKKGKECTATTASANGTPTQ